MYVIEARNVNDAFFEARWKMRGWGEVEQTRNGEVKAAPKPVATVYRKPMERMLFCHERDANPFFHIMEAMWMLGGNNDVELPAMFAKNMRNYSDDSRTLNGAYGFRWRNQFDCDQLLWVIEHLTRDPHSRRAHIGMWDPACDPESINNGSSDVPCNTGIDFRVGANGALNMTVYCRSNDIVWGCYGANAVHMSILQEFVAQALDRAVGTYTQVSNNWHVYPQHYALVDSPAMEHVDFYLTEPKHVKLLEYPGDYVGFLDIINEFLTDVVDQDISSSYGFKYIDTVLVPMARTWIARKIGMAITEIPTLQDEAVRYACEEWLLRRVKNL